MRVIGGEFRGRRLPAPVAGTVRPTTDRVREAVFDILFSLGGVEGMQVADLFAGTGAMGIEALSRGAASVTFVDRDPVALGAVRQNLEAVGLAAPEREGDATVVRADVDTWVAATLARFDLVFCDPPYDYRGWDRLIALLPGDLGVLESDAALPAVPGWSALRSRRYGGTLVTVVAPDGSGREVDAGSGTGAGSDVHTGTGTRPDTVVGVGTAGTSEARHPRDHGSQKGPT